MKKNILFVLVTLTFFVSMFFIKSYLKVEKQEKISKIYSSSSPKGGSESKKGRSEYFQRMLKDPSTNEIPNRIRQRELAFADELGKKNNLLSKGTGLNALTWTEAGPNNVGGRTRALAVDVSNSNNIIVGGASGGIWKSTDNGETWTLKSSPTTILSVTSIAQDRRPGKTNIWYYTTGEFNSNLAGSYSTRFSGDGIYKSTDNGETWNVLPSTLSANITGWDSNYDYSIKIEVSPITGSVFVASQAIGIYRSNDEGATFSLVLGGINEHWSSDISVAADGSMIAVISQPSQPSTTQNVPGVYKSSDDGVNWTNITPSTFPQNHQRSVIEIAPSNTNVGYILTFTGDAIDQNTEDVRFHKINISNGSSEDRSSNMPSFEFYDGQEGINTQGGYNMTLAIKPDDENYVIIGATSLFRSTNGFSTKPSDGKSDWIGGYHPFYFQYPNFHSDIHSFAFDPTNPKSMWWGHDGGLSYTADITNSSYSDVFPWENKNNSYNVTQLYHISIPNIANDGRIMGGTQDNGTPYIKFEGTSSNQIEDVSTGDGAYSYFGSTYPYFSSQNGSIMRGEYDNANNPTRQNPNWSNITPPSATGQLFINPFVINPNNENVMIYPAGNTIWRNDQLNSLPNNPSFGGGMETGWSQLSNLSLPEGYIVTALAFSESSPLNRLYYGGSDRSFQPTGTPKIYRLDNANTATNGAIEISIAGMDAGAFINNIVVNPDNTDEIVVIFSNYNIVGLYHSTNGGQSYSAIEGNLEGDGNNPGPSIRDAAILPSTSGTQYILATSIGVFSTSSINGNNTVWSQEGQNVMGNVIVSSIKSRKSDGRIVAGTHGRGIFVAQASTGSAAVADVNVSSLTLQSNPGQTGSTSFVLSNSGDATLNYNISVNGSFNKSLNKSSESKNYISKPDKSTIEFVKKRNESRQNSKSTAKVGLAGNYGKDSKLVPNSLNGNDILILDDGSIGADDFFGYPDGSDLYWFNEFNISGFNFELDALQFFMQTGQASSNFVDVGIYDDQGNLLSFGALTLQLAQNGNWFEITLNPALIFNSGDTFLIEIVSKSSIPYAAGVDTDAMVKNKSSYFNWGTSLYNNLNTISGFENGAFLIRAIGTKNTGGGGNQNPNAVATVSKTQAEVNEIINFDASQSTDDGQITQYLWNFGDGTTSNQKSTTHSYSQANTYNYSLTVTDNLGATGQVTGQIIISDNSNNLVTVNPASGSIQPGGSETVTLTLNAQSISEGTYTGQVNVNTNGGNFTIPVNYLVDVEQTSFLPSEFSLSQNYPNPFNPNTIIEFSLPKASEVSLKIYDMLGKEIVNLVEEQKSAGKYKIDFDASSLSSGIYFYKLDANNYSQSRKMLLLK